MYGKSLIEMVSEAQILLNDTYNSLSDFVTQKRWSKELKMYFKIYGNLIYKVPHYQNRIMEPS